MAVERARQRSKSRRTREVAVVNNMNDAHLKPMMLRIVANGGKWLMELEWQKQWQWCWEMNVICTFLMPAHVGSPGLQWGASFTFLCGLRQSVLGKDRPETKKIGLGLGLAGLVLCCETRSCHARRRTQQLFKSYLRFFYSVFGTSLLWRSTVAFTYLKVNPPSAFVYFRWSWSWS